MGGRWAAPRTLCVLGTVALATLLLACPGPDLPPPRVKHHFTTCKTPPAPAACSGDQLPVCAHLKTGGWRTYPSACSACSDAEVLGWRRAPCEAE